jgi:hypothetical protein
MPSLSWYVTQGLRDKHLGEFISGDGGFDSEIQVWGQVGKSLISTEYLD